MRSRGHDADLLDPLTDDLVDDPAGPYDGVWASACLLHVAREDLPTVLRRLAGGDRPGGAARHVAQGGRRRGAGRCTATSRAPRRFVYWREAPLRGGRSTEAGWRVQDIAHGIGQQRAGVA